MAIQQKKLEDAAFVFEIWFHRPGIRRRVSNDLIQSSIDEAETDTEMLHLDKDILDSDEYRAVLHEDSVFKAFLKRVAVSSGVRKSVYIIPEKLLERVDLEYEKYLIKRRARVKEYIGVYPERVEEAKGRLGTKVFNQKDYPGADAVEAAFSVSARYISFNVPAKLAEVDPKIAKREQERSDQEQKEMLARIKQELRTNMVKLAQKFIEALTPKKDGKRRPLKQKMLGRFTEFLELFDYRNLANDIESKKLAGQMFKMMQGLDVKLLKQQEDRDELKGRFEGLVEKASKLAGVKPALRKMLD